MRSLRNIRNYFLLGAVWLAYWARECWDWLTRRHR